MKIAAKTLLIITIIAGVIGIPFTIVYALHVIPLIFNAAGQESVSALIPFFRTSTLVFGIISSILCVVFASLTLWKLNTVSNKRDMIVWGILAIIFAGVVSGIVVLCLKDSDFIENKAKENILDAKVE